MIKESEIELAKRGVKLYNTLSNGYNGVDLLFLFKEGLSLIINGLSSNFNKHFLFSLISTRKLSKDGEWF